MINAPIFCAAALLSALFVSARAMPEEDPWEGGVPVSGYTHAEPLQHDEPTAQGNTDMFFDPEDDLLVHGFSTETEPLDDYLPPEDRAQANADDDVDDDEDDTEPQDWDLTVADGEDADEGDLDVDADDRVAVTGQAFLSMAAADQGHGREPGLSEEKDLSADADRELGVDMSDVSDEDVFDDEDFGDDAFDAELDSILDADDMEGVREVYADAEPDKPLTEEHLTDAGMEIEVEGQAVLRGGEGEEGDPFLFQLEEVNQPGAMLGAPSLGEDFVVTGQSVKVADEEPEPEGLGDAEREDEEDDLFLEASEHQEKVKIKRLFEDSLASLHL